MSAECTFCKIIAGEIPSRIIVEDDEIIAFYDINPQAPTHILIVTKKHISDALALTDDEAHLVGRVYIAANHIARELDIADRGFRIVTNTGMHAGQEVDHLHFHLLGGRPFAWPPG